MPFCGCRRSQKEIFLPEEITMLKQRGLSGLNSETDLLMILDHFRGITQGSRLMNLEQFMEFL